MLKKTEPYRILIFACMRTISKIHHYINQKKKARVEFLLYSKVYHYINKKNCTNIRIGITIFSAIKCTYRRKRSDVIKLNWIYNDPLQRKWGKNRALWWITIWYLSCNVFELVRWFFLTKNYCVFFMRAQNTTLTRRKLYEMVMEISRMEVILHK